METVLAPSVLVLQSGDFIFGGFIATPWRSDGTRFGNPKGFLFSITLDLKFPYHGRQRDSRSTNHGMSTVQHDCVLVTHNFMQFGLKDLTMEANLQGYTHIAQRRSAGWCSPTRH